MIITFFGHSDFYETGNIRERMMDIIAEAVNGEQVDFFLGGYGQFDAFAYSCSKQYKEVHASAKLIFITPYADNDYLTYRKADYDEIIYPEIENKPKKIAITYRNKWMVEKADLILAYVKRSCGGAYQTYKYAKSIGKKLINLSELIK